MKGFNPGDSETYTPGLSKTLNCAGGEAHPTSLGRLVPSTATCPENSDTQRASLRAEYLRHFPGDSLKLPHKPRSSAIRDLKLPETPTRCWQVAQGLHHLRRRNRLDARKRNKAANRKTCTVAQETFKSSTV